MDFKKDTHAFGGFLGLVVPILAYLLLVLIAWGVKSFFGVDTKPFLDPMRLISIAVNLIIMRYYFVKLKYDLTGRGILLVTFIYVIVYFWAH